MNNPMPWIPDLMCSLFCLALYVKITRAPKPVAKPVPVVVKSIYPIQRGRMS